MKGIRIYLPFVLILFFTLAACTPASSVSSPEPTAAVETGVPASETPQPTIAPTATSAPTLSPAELKYLVLADFPNFFYCDPDYFPIARADEADLAVQRFPELQADAETFDAILEHLGWSGAADFSPEQQLQIYREYKKLAALVFEESGDGYRFQIQVAETEGPGELVSGQIDGQGAITVTDRSSTIATCPICLAAGTLIDTPNGPRPVESLRIGTPVWTLDAAGRRVARPLIRVSRTLVPSDHLVVHLILEDGRQLWVSPGHPTADGRTVGELQAGDHIGDGLVASARLVVYRAPATYDLLPAGETGFYWADGIMLGSTLEGALR